MTNPFHHLARGIFIKDNQVLLAQAIGEKNTFLPGGHIEFCESAKDALAREVEEELGISCTVGNFLGLVEHKWEKKGILNCEVNQVFEVTSKSLTAGINPQSSEPHLQFFWCKEEDLDNCNLQPYPFRQLIQKYMNGKKNIWWESTLNYEIEDSNRS
ncbi:NUDIX domain-containing protein [Sporosarcina thermotolerans]|uniref:NUDIX domain-containing protein n=1 Tax=Sporosarcina thermotolerans TaxID=633404 RepID=A0AAW9A7A2_9BACL|nr:NUDIX domain-containing protein [Sporosarcina thermotolerans]MDW0117052.1 NUDIX domain-containing protein [Sporosarcina thermotolerans]WHT47846.1 NUDIX domain-containing protein [Sporosarcina thermotolerans]